jgi:hypothetical protein
MARTHLTDKQIRAPYNKGNAVAIKAKLDDLDVVADTVEAGGSAVLSQIHHVRGASTGNVANLAAFTVANDGIALVAADRVLLKDQTDPVQNGIYVVGTVGGGTAPLARATDWDTATELKQGTMVHVAGGTAGANTFWQITSDFPATVGTTHQHFVAQWTTTAVLTADVGGRALMATGYFDETKATDAFAAQAIVGSLIKNANIAAAQLATDAVETAKIKNGEVTMAKLTAASLDGTVAKVVADANVIGGIPVVHRIAVADGVTGDVDVVLTHKTLVTDVHVVKTAGAGGAGDTITVKNAATAITNALDINIADKVVVRAGTIDDAQHEIAAGGTLKVTRTKGSGANVACVVYVTGLRVA